jgi:hypothetical protein
MIRGPACSSGPERGKGPSAGKIEFRGYSSATLRQQFDNRFQASGYRYQVYAGAAGIRDVLARFIRRLTKPTAMTASEQSSFVSMRQHRAFNWKE